MGNPIDWVKGKFKKKKTPFEESFEEQVNMASKGLPEAPPPKPPKGKRPTGSAYWYEEAQRQKSNAASIDEERRQEEASRKKSQKEYQEYRQRQETNNPNADDLLSRLSPKDRKKYEKIAKESASEEARARLEAKAAGVSEYELSLQKIYQSGRYIDTVTGETISYSEYERRKAAGDKDVDYVPGQWTLQDHKRSLSPMELRVKTAIQSGQLNVLKDVERERKLAPYREVASVAGGALKSMAGTVGLGVAGVASSIQPSRKAVTVASRTLVPKNVPNSLYSMRAPNPSLSGARGVIRTPAANMGSLRASMLPRVNSPNLGRMPVTPSRPIGQTPRVSQGSYSTRTGSSSFSLGRLQQAVLTLPKKGGFGYGRRNA